MISHSQAYARSRHHRGKAFLLGVGALALLAVVGFAAYKYFFERPGEAAAALIPGDADVVVTLDTNPSERQFETFQKITNALEREGIAQKIDDTLKGFLEGKPVGAEIRPYLSRSFALGFWMKENKGPEVLTLCAVSNPGAVRGALEKHCTARSGGIYLIPGTNDQLHASVVDGFLALASGEETLQRIDSVRSGQEASVTRLAEFNAARSALPKDANLMVFMSPRFFQEMQKQFGAAQANAFKGSSWMAYGATVEPEGIAFDYYCPWDASKWAALKAVADTKPFNLDSLKMLPQGAYGVCGYSQAAKYWDVFQSAAKETPEMKQQIDKGVAEMEAETGLKMEEDIVPAFKGEQIVAVYPGASGKPEDVDVILIATDANGANPAQLATKFRELAEKKSAEKGKPVKFTESKIGDVTVWEIDPKSREEMTKAFFQGFSGTRNSKPEPMKAPEGMQIPDNAQFQALPGEAPKVVDEGASAPPQFMNSKTIVYAQIGNSVVAASSRAILTRAIEGRQSGKSLADEASFATMKSHVVDGSQMVLLVNLRRIMEAVKPMFEDNLKNAPITADDIVGMFGDGMLGLVASGKYDGKIGVGRLLLPLDFERCIHMVGSGMRAGEHRM